MRPLKFRAWDTKASHYPKGGPYAGHDFFIGGEGTIYEEATIRYDTPNKEIQQASFVIEQFTGLLDRNRKEIYEGDVVPLYGKNWLVVWSHDRWNLGNGRGKNIDDDNDQRDPVNFYWREYEVIGNVHENPELLK